MTRSEERISGENDEFVLQQSDDFLRTVYLRYFLLLWIVRKVRTMLKFKKAALRSHFSKIHFMEFLEQSRCRSIGNFHEGDRHTLCS